MQNLRDETLECLKAHGKDWVDVRWIGHKNGNVKIHPDYFLEIANKDYAEGFGGQEVNESLVVVGDDWWLERGEYDGSEWWDFHTLPILNANAHLGQAVFIKDYGDDWSIMSNLDYLEWLNERKTSL